MKLIQTLCEKIEEEISDAGSYAKLALEVKTDYPILSKNLYTLSTQEMEHFKILHDSVVDIIKDYRDEHGEPPSSMLAVYEYVHKRQIDKAADVKILQSMYKE